MKQEKKYTFCNFLFHSWTELFASCILPSKTPLTLRAFPVRFRKCSSTELNFNYAENCSDRARLQRTGISVNLPITGRQSAARLRQRVQLGLKPDNGHVELVQLAGTLAFN